MCAADVSCVHRPCFRHHSAITALSHSLKRNLLLARVLILLIYSVWLAAQLRRRQQQPSESYPKMSSQFWLVIHPSKYVLISDKCSRMSFVVHCSVLVVSPVCVCVLSCSPHANKYIIILRAILQSRRLLPSCS